MSAACLMVEVKVHLCLHADRFISLNKYGSDFSRSLQQECSMKLKPAVRTSALIHLTETIAHVFPSCALCNYKVIFINAILKKKKATQHICNTCRIDTNNWYKVKVFWWAEFTRKCLFFLPLTCLVSDALCQKAPWHKNLLIIHNFEHWYLLEVVPARTMNVLSKILDMCVFHNKEWPPSLAIWLTYVVHNKGVVYHEL